MLQIFFSSQWLSYWGLLAVGAVVAGVLGRKVGRLAVLAVFGVVWTILFSLALAQELHLLEYSIARILSELWVGPTFAVAFTMIPVLWVTGKASIRKASAWGIGGASFVMFVFAPIMFVVQLRFIPDDHRPCSLPSLESPIPSRTTSEVGTRGYFSDTCPIPIARELEFERDYGIVSMSWWSSPHRLRISGKAPNGEPLRIGVNRVDPTGCSQDSPEPGESRTVTFWRSRYSYTCTPPPDQTEEFSITVFGESGEPIEEIPLRYIPRQCTCVFYATRFRA